MHYATSTRPSQYLDLQQGVIKGCRLSWLTYSALVYEHKCGGMGLQAAVHMEPK
jgi:hypothetical protein